MVSRSSGLLYPALYPVPVKNRLEPIDDLSISALSLKPHENFNGIAGLVTWKTTLASFRRGNIHQQLIIVILKNNKQLLAVASNQFVF